MARTTSPAEFAPAVHRSRDLVGALVVLMIGASMVFTIFTGGYGESVDLAMYAFATGGALIVLAYGGGTVVDHLSQRFPGLIRTRRNPLLLVVLALTALALLAVTYIDTTLEYLPWLEPYLPR